MEFGSVCSGIEAASVAWHGLGWRAVWLAEVDRAASEVLAHRFPDTPNHGDMTLLAGMIRRREIPAPDALVGGTPCQSFSVAGLRRGLADERGQLTIAFIDLANAIDEVRAADGKPPVIIVWENVPGVLTHKDNPFGCFLAGLAGEGDALLPAGRKWTHAGAVLGPERAIAWRVLDAQYLGLAQRRRRVFVVASAREGFDPAAILLEFDGLRRDSAPRREAGEGVTGPLDARPGSGFPGTDGTCSGHVIPEGRDDGRLQRPVAPTLRASGHAESHCNGGSPPAVAYQVLPFDTTQVTSPSNYSRPQEGGTGHPLAAGAHPPAVCVTGSVTHTLKADGFDASEDGTGRGQPITVAFQANSRDEVRLMGGDGQISGCLAAEPGSRGTTTFLAAHMAVRRLMPVECERLQGFPDGWTAVPTGPKRKPAADGPRYKQLGNSMAVNVMRWIGYRIARHLEMLAAGYGHNGGPMIDDFDDLLAPGDDFAELFA